MLMQPYLDSVSPCAYRVTKYCYSRKPGNCPACKALTTPGDMTAQKHGGGYFFVISNLAALSVAYYVTVPAYETYFKPNLVSGANPLLDTLANFTAPFLYNPRLDHLLNKCYLSSLIGFYSMTIIGTVLDCFPSLFLKYKTQGNRSYFTVKEWLEANVVAIFNLGIASWFVTLPCCYLWKSLWGTSFDVRGNAELKNFDVKIALFHLAVIFLVVDTWFYWTHRLLHVHPLYNWIHKFHHRFKAPTAVASVYANPVEFTVGNHLGVALGPCLVNPHPYVAYFWFFLALFSTGGSHSGYYFFGAEGHDIHHEKFNYNFGVGGFMDYLCGTKYEVAKKKK